MSNLSPQQINNSFPGLLQVPGGITSTLKTVQDGNGNPTGLQISSTGSNLTTTSTYVASENGTQFTGAVPRAISDGFGDIVSVKDFGAVGNGVTNDTTAFANAEANGKLLWVPLVAGGYTFPSPVTNTQGAFLPEPTLSWTNFTDNGNLDWNRGFFTDTGNGANIWRFKDRVMVGDAADYSGNRLGVNGYGDSWTINKGANYFIKNATMGVSALETDSLGARRYGIVGFSKSMGVGAVAVNDGVSTSARALYAEVFHQPTVSGASSGLEIQVGNYTPNFPVCNAYNVANVQVSGLYVGAESGYNYTVGNNDTPITAPTQPAGCAIDISGGSQGLSYQKWVTGMIFRNGALYRDPITNLSTAISLARQHEIIWGVGASAPRISFIRSDNTDANTPIGLILQNSTINVVGAGNQKVVELVDVRPTTFDAVNYMRLFNSQTNTALQIVAAGSDADIDLQITPKGTGVVRYGTHTASADAPISGYITIKDAAGNLRKLAVIS